MQTISKNRPEAYSEPCQIFKTELFAKIVQDWKLRKKHFRKKLYLFGSVLNMSPQKMVTPYHHLVNTLGEKYQITIIWLY